MITGFNFIEIGTVQGLDATDVSFTDHSVTVNIAGTIWDGGEGYIIELQTSHDGAFAIPEPTTAALGLLGVAGLMVRAGMSR